MRILLALAITLALPLTAGAVRVGEGQFQPTPLSAGHLGAPSFETIRGGDVTLEVLDDGLRVRSLRSHPSTFTVEGKVSGFALVGARRGIVQSLLRVSLPGQRTSTLGLGRGDRPIDVVRRLQGALPASHRLDARPLRRGAVQLQIVGRNH